MSELWWAEAAIPVDREPDWASAYAAAAALSVEQLDCKWEEYVAQLDEPQMRALDAAAATLLPADSAEHDGLLLAHVHGFVRDELDLVAALWRAVAYVCAFEAAGLREFVHCSGYGPGPDRLGDAWLNVHGLGLLQAAGFVGTRALDGGV